MCQRIVIVESVDMNLCKTHIMVCVNTCFKTEIVLCFTLTTRTVGEDPSSTESNFCLNYINTLQIGDWKTYYRKGSSSEGQQSARGGW